MQNENNVNKVEINEELEKASGGLRPSEPEPDCASDYSCEPHCATFNYCPYYDRCGHPDKNKNIN